ncbi:hypothetical protein TVAG_167170 [Trichomonas vaginalis G3]|uniref:6-phosphogluconolactonase n=1 Tax=Trichomonas vaginalis (strain ATCC PRA-98 / G3) TaxID=412133 RepID=A2DEC4_TRIV3|nr:lactonase, 7-bladed beta-propeller [Trichomonas vaginalis G3]EAY21342.1 hypothetical protein TVAG_167170 [Trichomonas vaginalis G3]KAI5548920.1 lactonase, 7-bladed beta-propeller [Trichomonas vaginalis G3]|eukprot:XP_001582328.1 hypothetical protein [Trichomonas vaginalis G3]
MLTAVVGTYTDNGSKGIYSLKISQNDGSFSFLESVEVDNPSYVILNRNNTRVYAVSEMHNEKAALVALEFEKISGQFKVINSQLTHGMDPCHLLLGDGFVVTANYSSGSITVFPLDSNGGIQEASQVIKFEGTGPDKSRQEMPHAHHVYFTPDRKFLLVNDLGTDKIHKFKVNSQAPFLSETYEDINVQPESGPRHSVFTKNGKYMYLINELNGHVNAFVNQNGTLSMFQSIICDSVSARGSADIHLSPDGKFLYASNRLKQDGICIYKIDSSSGYLSKVGYQITGIHPRIFDITPNGKFLYVCCRDSNCIEVYQRSLESGLLRKDSEIKLPHPVCIKFVELN